ncbi:hypothetical protein CSUB01_12647 [Colletotrichum sublineola]|uniref:Uncharacterized protein n=1 Tax=Colletotrichum sublineola TaxID=1173701 RepID=A0A066XCH1_COLSU|nr:hypothetical protein CSUB01_12647 [Colletotrichum sublineola]
MESMNQRYDMVCEAHSKTFEWLVSKTWEDATEPELPQLDSDFYSLGGIGAAFSSYAPSREAKEKEIDERDDILSDIGGWNQFPTRISKAQHHKKEPSGFRIRVLMPGHGD